MSIVNFWEAFQAIKRGASARIISWEKNQSAAIVDGDFELTSADGKFRIDISPSEMAALWEVVADPIEKSAEEMRTAYYEAYQCGNRIAWENLLELDRIAWRSAAKKAKELFSK